MAMRLTPALQQQMCAFIRAGGYPQVAAAAAGVSPQLFETWLRRGRERPARQPYRGFVLAIEQAAAQARLAAETNVFQANACNWLKFGPGKETPTASGWTTSARAYPAAAAANMAPLADPVLRELLAALLRALLPFPEARAAVAPLIEDLGR